MDRDKNEKDISEQELKLMNHDLKNPMDNTSDHPHRTARRIMRDRLLSNAAKGNLQDLENLMGDEIPKEDK